MGAGLINHTMESCSQVFSKTEERETRRNVVRSS